MQKLVINLPNADKISAELSAEVRLSFHPTTIEVVLNDNSECRPSAADFKNVLTPAAPGNNVDSLAWVADGPLQFRYGHQVQQTASEPYPPMYVFYPDLDTGVGNLCFDKLEAGYPCAVENTETGKLYTRMRVVNNDGSLREETGLKFTSGSVLLIG
jgi:hypothetical protein